MPKPGIHALQTMDAKAPFHPSNLLPEGLDLPAVAQHAKLDFALKETPALMMDPRGLLRQVPDRKVVFREDNNDPLSIVSTGYKVVQPAQVLDFYSSLIDESGFKMRAAGSLLGGKRIWAMAETGESFSLPGGDDMEGFLFLATSCDGSMATTGFFTTLRAHCWNMLQRMILEAKERRMFIKVNHSKEFDAEEYRKDMLLSQASWNDFTSGASALAERKVNDREAIEYLTKVLGEWDDTKTAAENITAQKDARNIAKVLQLFKGEGAGSNLKSADGTAWGLVNAVTEFMDHHRGARSADSRFNNAVLGDSFNRKTVAWEEGLKLAA